MILHPSVAGRRLVDVWLADDEQDVLWPSQSNPSDTLDMLETQLRDCFARLLLVPAVHSDLSTSGDVGLSTFLIRIRGLVLNLWCILLLWLVGELFDTWVGHIVGSEEFGGAERTGTSVTERLRELAGVQHLAAAIHAKKLLKTYI